MEAKHEHRQPTPAAANRFASDSLCPGDSRSRERGTAKCEHG